MQSIRTVCRRTAVATTVVWGVGKCVCVFVEGGGWGGWAACWPLAGFVLRCLKFKFLAMLLNSHGCLMPVGFLILFCAIWIICV